MKKLSAIALLLFLCALGVPALALHPYMTFDDLVQKSDLIFEGKVIDMQSRYGPDHKMILTDVTFKAEKHIYIKESAASQLIDPVILTIAGGEIGGERVMISGTPVFELDKRYLIFTLLDGKTYASPIIGGTQGLFKIEKDGASGKDYPLTYGRSAILGFEGPNLSLGPQVAKIQGGLAESAATGRDRLYRVPPQQAGGGPGNAMVSPKVEQSRSKEVRPIDLDRLISEIYKRIK